MKTRLATLVTAAFAFGLLTAGVSVPTAQEIVQKLLDADPFGFSGASVTAQINLQDKAGTISQMAFTGRSVRYDPPYAKSLIRFTAPADLMGAGFLQIQQRSSDDERYLFLPDLKRSRRISGSLRSTSFMGTDFSFADLDRRDFRESEAVSKPDEPIGKFACYRVDVRPKRADTPYSKIEAWIRKDNALPLKLKMYDKANTLLKTFTAIEVKRIEGTWYVTRSRMVDHARSHTTELVLSSVTPLKAADDDEFTVRNLEKL